jgi:hypothetical protein
VSQPLIAKAEPSGLLTRIAATGGALLCTPAKSLRLFWNLNEPFSLSRIDLTSRSDFP